MVTHRAECQDCGEEYTDDDLLKVSNWAEDHQRSEFHDVDIEKAVATDGGQTPWMVHCQDCDYDRTFATGTVWTTPEERAQSAAGGHEGEKPGHEVTIQPVDVATDGGFDHVIVSRFKTQGVWHDPSTENPDEPACQCADNAKRDWQRRSLATLSDRYSYCKYCDPDEHVAPKDNSGGEFAAMLRNDFSDIEDGELVPDGGEDLSEPIEWSFDAVVHGAQVDEDCLALTGSGKPCSYNAYPNEDPVCNTHARADDPEIVDDGHQWARISDGGDTVTVCVNCELVVDGREPEAHVDCPDCRAGVGDRCRDETSAHSAPIPPHPQRRRRAYEAVEWYEPCEENPAGSVDEDQERLTDGGVDIESGVVVSTETAQAALLEVEAAIERTGGPEVGAEGACSPLAAVRDAVASEPGLDEHARGYVLAAIDEIAEKRGVDASGSDPLTDATFQAANELHEVLDENDAGVDDDQTELTDGGHGPAAASAGAQIPRDDLTFATDEGPHKCDLCLRVFEDVDDLAVHECLPLEELVDDDGGESDG